MNKNDLVAAVANSASLSKADAAKAVDSVFDAITASLKKGQEVRLVGFGTFAVAKRKASEGRNPRTGAHVSVAQKSVPFFKTGKEMRERLNKSIPPA